MTVPKTTLRRFEREWRKVEGLLAGIDAGAYDHKFRDAETKAAVRADLDEESRTKFVRMLRADPEVEGLPDGSFRRKKNVVPIGR